MSESTTCALFPVITVDSGQSIWDEALGTKRKFWIEREGERWLFKYARENTGEDWSEKLAFEIARTIGIDAAYVELARCGGKAGTLSRSFIDHSKDESLVHGNEILAGQVFGYDPNKRFGQFDHTLENIQSALGKLFEDDQREEVQRCLASFLVLDALIGNTDRHHENWGLLFRPKVVNNKVVDTLLRVAPTFDHASSLGRDLLDVKIVRFLEEEKGVERYVRKGKGAIYRSSGGRHGENPLELVRIGHHRYPHLFNDVLFRVQAVPLADVLALVDKIPPERMSSLANRFVKAFLTYTHGQLCNLAT